jgi:pyruvate dehydrogenase E1 component
MYQDHERIFYYLTCMNENYVQPPMPPGVKDGILRGMYLVRVGGQGKVRVQLFGSGTILREVLAAAEILVADYDIPADVWSVTSFSELRRDGMDCDRWNMRHPKQSRRNAYVTQSLVARQGPFVAASDYMRIVADQIRPWIPGHYVVLGTDGYGRSDSRRALRDFFEVDRKNVVLAALNALQDEGSVDARIVAAAIKKLDIDTDKPDPTTV